MMITFTLGNPQTIEELTQRTFVVGKFVFRRDNKKFRLFLGEFSSHPQLVEGLKILKQNETPYGHIWGGGSFEVSRQSLRFYDSSSNYGQVPNSFLIDCCRHVSFPAIRKFVFALSPYFLDDPLLEERRKTWKKLGNYDLDTERKVYTFDERMQPL